ncbi:MAG: hypothetical protein PWP23_1433 [Candidatus Sumerlaeota bacterium]|nr:hypothetical protein [Candidatus Sumerlaeota bacterium]
MGSASPRLATRPAKAAGALALAALLTLGASNVAAESFTVSYDGPPVVIPDNNETGVTVQLPVSGITGFIRDLDFSFDGHGPCSTTDSDPAGNVGLVHPWVGDLTVTLTGPTGRSVVLLSRPNGGRGGANFCHTILDDEATTPIQSAGEVNAPFSNVYSPAESLTTYDEVDPNGIWLLTISDRSAQDTGTLYGFSLYIETDPIAPPNTAPVLSVVSPNTDTLSSVTPYTLSGTALDFDGELARVEYRVLPSATWVTGTDSSGDWTSWLVAAPLSNGSNMIQIRAVDDEGRASAWAERTIEFDSTFNSPPTVVVEEPTQDLIVDSSVASFSWEGTATDSNGTIVRVQFRNDDGDPDTIDTQYEATIIEDNGSNVRWRITLDQASIPPIVDDNNLVFTAIDDEGAISSEVRRRVRRQPGQNLLPTVQITDPDSNRIVSVTETTYDFFGTAFDPDGSVVALEYRYTTETTYTPPASDKKGETKRFVSDWIPITTVNPALPAQSVTWEQRDIPLENEEGGLNLIEVRARDIITAGPSGSREVLVLPVDLNAPVTTITSPESDTTVPSTQTTITVSGTGDAGADLVRTVLFRINGSAFAPANITPGQNQSSTVSWNFTASLFQGTNFYEIKTIDNTGQEGTLAGVTVIRGDDTRMPPVVTIIDPTADITVSNDVGTYVVKGTATDQDSTIQRVEFRAGNSLAEVQSAPFQNTVNDTGTWSQWSVPLNLNTFANIIQIRAVDTTGVTGNIVSRVITRQSAPPTVTITEPVDGYVAFSNESSVAVRGNAVDIDGTIELVRYRVGLETTFNSPWQTASRVSGTFGTWTFDAPLATGLNLVEVQAFDNDNVASEIAARNIVRRKPGTAEDLTVLTQFTDVWGTINTAGSFGAPARFAFVGFKHDPANGWLTFAGNFDADGLTDFATVTEFGDVWLSLNNGSRALQAPFKSSAGGWNVDGLAGDTVLAGDFDANGLTDLVQLRANGDLALALNTNNRIDPPVAAGNTTLRHDQPNMHFVATGDLNGDSRDDLVEVNGNTGEVRVALSTGTGFAAATTWGVPNFIYDPATDFGVHVADFNGDERDDVLQINDGEAIVSLSMIGSDALAEPSVWGTLGFHDDNTRGDGWWVFALDIDGNGAMDLVQINEFGEAWVSLSTGRGSFQDPEKNAALGFHHKPEGLWQVFPAIIE